MSSPVLKAGTQTLIPLLLDLSRQDREKRKRARESLLKLESEGRTNPSLLVEQLFSEDLGVNAKTYLVQALGRTGEPRVFPFLARFFSQTGEILILIELLKTFESLGDDHFIGVVLEKLEKPSLKKRRFPFGKKKAELSEEDNSKAMVRFACTIPALKYFQKAGNDRTVPFLEASLGHVNANVRFNALLAFRKTGLPVSGELLSKVAKGDPADFNVRLANLMLDPPAEEE